MAKKKAVAVEATVAGADQCQYKCLNGTWKLVVNNAPQGSFCPFTLSGGCTEGNTKWTPASVIPDEPLSLVANSAEYVYRKSTKSLYFNAGTCGKGKHFPPVITAKELTKIDPDAAELVKSMQKNKRIASFSVVLKAQKIDPA